MIELTAAQAAAAIARGVMSAEEYTGACLDRIAAAEDEVRAFAHLDPGHALAQARALDRRKAEGGRLGPLHGVPVAIKDIFDTADYPTECGSPVLAGRRPNTDSAVVRRLREAGAVIIGKTVTTELAYFHPGKTRNPRDVSRTPGGSSSGSAAAVAAGMVAARDRIADQRLDDPPGRVLRRVRCQAEPWPDLARGCAHALAHARPCRCLCPVGRGSCADPRCSRRAGSRRSGFAALCVGELSAPAWPIRPRCRRALQFVRTPVWDNADAEARSAVEELARDVDAREVDLPDDYPRRLARAARDHGRRDGP